MLIEGTIGNLLQADFAEGVVRNYRRQGRAKDQSSREEIKNTTLHFRL